MVSTFLCCGGLILSLLGATVPQGEGHHKIKCPLEIVVAGAQTGIDSSAFRAARLAAAITDSVLLTAGFGTFNLRNEDGVIDTTLYSVQPTPYDRSRTPGGEDVPRSRRTELNCLVSDATLVIQPVNAPANWPANDPGTAFSIKICKDNGRPVYILDVNDEGTFQKKMLDLHKWLCDNHVRVLNVSGPAFSASPLTSDRAYRFLLELFIYCKQ